MLVVVWEGMYAAIPQLQAEEMLAAYAVAVTATPAQDDRGVRDRENVLAGWRKQMRGAVARVRDSAPVVSFRKLGELLRGAFQEGIRD